MRIYLIGNDGITLCRKAPATVTRGVGSRFVPTFSERGIKQRRHEPLSKPRLCHAVPTVRIRFPQAESPCLTQTRPLQGREPRLWVSFTI